MEERYTIKQFLLDEKNGIMPDYFKYKFYKNLKENKLGYKEGQFDSFLDELYKKDNLEYINWYKVLGKIQYEFLKKYPYVITELVRNNDMEKLITALSMYKDSERLVNKCVPMWATATNVNNRKKELLVSIYMQLELMESELEDNILRKTQEDFYNKYKEYNNDTDLTRLYNEILDNFEKEIRNILIKQLEKANMLYDKYIDRESTARMVDARIADKKRRHDPKTYGKY